MIGAGIGGIAAGVKLRRRASGNLVYRALTKLLGTASESTRCRDTGP